MDSKKRSIVIAIMVAMFLGAVEGTVVTTAVPTIVRELNGFELISWVFSLYLLTSAISTPIYGKLADLYGRKNVLSIGIIIFLIGSSLCGLSRSMHQLIAFRALQGLGAGAIFTVTYTIVGDVFDLSERAKVQGWISSTWGIASLAGPFLGGFLIDYLSWHWIFFINIPFGILSIWLLQRNLNENFTKKKCKIDYAGTVALSSAIIFLLYGTMAGGKGSFSIMISLMATALALAAFYFIEKRAEEPIIPFEIFTKTNIIVNIISFLASAVLIAADVYMPLYMQNVLGFGATISGLSMAPMSVTWLLSSVVLGKAIPKYGEKIVIGVSSLIILISCIFLPTLDVNSSLLLVIIYVSIMGFGFGGCFTTLTIVVQSSVDYSKRGAATASNSLVRTLGQTIGVSVFGSMFNLSIIKYFSKLGIMGIDPSNLYSASSASTGVSLEQIKASLNSGLHLVFIVLICITAISLLLSFTLPSGLKNEEVA
ncbi:MFS transporter [Clostridium sp. CX1]|uniref:MDR family MFS transporter n=1 Tax=Clostridium tanneri TaxID=3037988 RepID=A0ABU4JRR7_9CLOT|nr:MULTISPECIES: MDR family MFS transporter [unclassified Clostridium]MCT8977826.1 MFS transporter [Clostridium sp. CX1]MDW8800820.1 MDR family MFS transporter [Clostridium sp. A1-XYC3]